MSPLRLIKHLFKGVVRLLAKPPAPPAPPLVPVPSSLPDYKRDREALGSYLLDYLSNVLYYVARHPDSFRVVSTSGGARTLVRLMPEWSIIEDVVELLPGADATAQLVFLKRQRDHYNSIYMVVILHHTTRNIDTKRDIFRNHAYWEEETTSRVYHKFGSLKGSPARAPLVELLSSLSMRQRKYLTRAARHFFTNPAPHTAVRSYKLFTRTLGVEFGTDYRYAPAQQSSPRALHIALAPQFTR